ncbi:MAG TPA: L-2-hydroxyglutarate oxidase [Candidatus Bathyarchaeia archaeon]|nr:L-2-hydroxyglutarate oxidase [Candidatus Bathyarchaeia archaeon]
MWDFVVVGAGIIGCSIARQLKLGHGKDVLVLEKESVPGLHASGRNSGVIHSGINQKPRSLKAKLCVRGGYLLKEFCKKNEVAMKEVGTVVLARTDQEIDVIGDQKLRAEENGVQGVRILDRQELKQIEPFAEAKQALFSPYGAIVDSKNLIAKIAQDSNRSGVHYEFGARVLKIEDEGDFLKIRTNNNEFYGKYLVNCAGLYADRIAQLMGVGNDYCIMPFRGDYYRLKAERGYLVNSMIYPAPNLAVPFLGIHLTRRTDDSVIVGPNALLALGREKYRDAHINWEETLHMLLDVRFTKLMSDRAFMKLAFQELKLSLSKEEFAKAAQDLVPEITSRDLIHDQSGIRAQLVDSKGHLVDDFLFDQTEKSFHVLNAVSPGMTSALAFAEEVDRIISDGKDFVRS